MRKKHVDKIRQQVKETYSSIAGEFDQTRKNLWLEFEHFLDYVKSDSKVLDLGCGNGRLYSLLKEKKVDYLGVDNNEALLKKARENFPDAEFKIGDMVSLDLPDESFDVVFSIAAFHHIPGKKLRHQVTKEMHRVLKPDGILILTVWNLFQWKYFWDFLRAILLSIFHLGLKYSWNDLWIRWGSHHAKRYYHAFLPRELKKYFRRDFKIEEFYFVKRGSRVKFWKSYNICLIFRKKK
jgi:ubiquinone/menaquinone biosynthesis C-methylase UbiE